MAKRNTTKFKSNKQEKDVAKQFEGKQVIASGSLWFADSDVRNNKFLIECKTTAKDFYSITTRVWSKIEKEALKDRMRTPLLVVDLKDCERYVIFNPKHFITQLNTYEVAHSVHGGCASYRLKGYSKEDLPILFSINKDGNKYTLLAMKIDEFLDKFKEEL